MRADIVPGATFPDYELPDQDGNARKLSALQQGDPMVLALLRGAFCPKDRQQLHDLVPFHAHMQVGYSRLVSITTDDTALQLNELRLGVGACWPFLLDVNRTIARDLDIVEYTDPDHDPMIPHTIVLEPHLKVYKIYDGYWFWGRPSICERHTDLREVSRRCRPDYDITDSPLRHAWERGDRSKFYPYSA